MATKKKRQRIKNRFKMLVISIIGILLMFYIIGLYTNRKVEYYRGELQSLQDNLYDLKKLDLGQCKYLKRIDGSKLLFCVSKLEGNTKGFHTNSAGVDLVVVEDLEISTLAHEFAHSETQYWANQGFKDVNDPKTQERWAYSIQNMIRQALEK